MCPVQVALSIIYLFVAGHSEPTEPTEPIRANHCTYTFVSKPNIRLSPFCPLLVQHTTCLSTAHVYCQFALYVCKRAVQSHACYFRNRALQYSCCLSAPAPSCLCLSSRCETPAFDCLCTCLSVYKPRVSTGTSLEHSQPTDNSSRALPPHRSDRCKQTSLERV